MHTQLLCLHLRLTLCLQVRRGNHPVHEQRHTVIFNWNKQLLPVLQQVREAGGLLAGAEVAQLEQHCTVLA